jgi:hypothetical protein
MKTNFGDENLTCEREYTFTFDEQGQNHKI